MVKILSDIILKRILIVAVRQYSTSLWSLGVYTGESFDLGARQQLQENASATRGKVSMEYLITYGRHT
jgi:hypothetical protein